MGNVTGTISGAGFSEIRVTQSVVFCVVLCND